MAFKQKPPLFFKTSVKGYRKDSPDKNEPKLKIPSNKISMEDVNHKVHGKDNLGNEKIMKPGKNYTFPGDYVVETPIKQKEIKDDIDFDEQYNIYYDKDIQKSYEQRRGRFAPKKTKEEKENKNRDRVVEKEK